MGTVIDLRTRRTRPTSQANGRYVICTHCEERHPVIRFADGTLRCLTAFADADRWFCRNRGCRAAWLAANAKRD